MTTFETFRPNNNFIEVTKLSRSDAVLSLGHAAFTLFITPEHEKLHQIAELESASLEPQPLQPPIEDILQDINDEVLSSAEHAPLPAMGARELLCLGGALIQFSDYNPRLKKNMKISYDHLQELHDTVISSAQETGPLTYSDQLDIALKLTDGNITEALWRLFVTSRHYGRWLDSGIIQGLPNDNREEKVNQMLDWRISIAACKERDEDLVQDPNGDTYYTWTHAFAKYMYSLAPKRESEMSRIAVRAFHNGTSIMHKAVHTLNKQSVHSDHSIAAQYGNAIGQACVDHVLQDRAAEGS